LPRPVTGWRQHSRAATLRPWLRVAREVWDQVVTSRAPAGYIRDVEGYEPGPADGELLRRLGEDRFAFEQFYRRHVTTVTRFLARRCSTPEDVADATSATFLAVMLSASTYDPRLGQAVTWLCSIAANEAKRLHRKKLRNNSLVNRVRGRLFLQPDDAERLAEMIDAEHEAASLQILITEAPKGEQELLRQMVANDVSVTEAAQVIGISSGAGRVRLSRLRSRLVQSRSLPTGGAPPEPGTGHMEGTS
jgi:RNA polymerase sigma factor (sigma-70 family)